MSTSNHDFGNKPVGSSPTTITVTLTNTSASAYQTINFSAPTNSDPFFISSSTCVNNILLAASGSCSFDINYVPTTPGLASHTYTFMSNLVQFGSVTVSGTGVAALSSSLTTLDLGAVNVGSTTATQSTQINNISGVDLFVSGGLTSPLTSSWAGPIGGTGRCLNADGSGKTLLAGQSCTLGWQFKPQTVSDLGPQSISRTLILNGQTFSINLSGQGVAPLNLDANTVNIGQVEVGKDSAPSSVNVLNVAPTGSAPFGPLSVSGGAPTNTKFTIGGSCNGATLNPAGVATPPGQCPVSYQYKPRLAEDLGPQTTFSNFTVSGKAFVVQLNATGVTTTVPTSLEFGTAGVNTSNITANLTLSNATLISLGPLSITVGTPSAGFTAGTNNCQAATLATSIATCTIQFGFAPTSLGSKNGTVDVTVNGITTTVNLHGTADTVSVPGSLAFGSRNVGNGPYQLALDITNGLSVPVADDGHARNGAGRLRHRHERVHRRHVEPGRQLQALDHLQPERPRRVQQPTRPDRQRHRRHGQPHRHGCRSDGSRQLPGRRRRRR